MKARDAVRSCSTALRSPTVGSSHAKLGGSGLLGQRAELFREHGGIWHGRKQKGGTALPQLLEKEEEGNQE